MNAIDPFRRKFLLSSLLFLSQSSFAKGGDLDLSSFLQGNRSLYLGRGNLKYNIQYFKDGEYNRQAYVDLCILSMDVKANAAVEMDVKLFDIMHFAQKYFRQQTNNNNPVILTSGYRTTQTNAQIEGAARNSLHLQGKGVDFKIPGISPYHAAYMARYFGAGGVGIYPTHTHIDTGSLRAWAAD